MKKRAIGFIYNTKRPTIEEKKFFKVADRMNIELVPFNLAEEIIEKEIEEKAKKCKIIYNDIGDYLAEELVKTLETFGKKVVEDSRAFYDMEDKWILFLKCKKNNIPTPETILLSANIESMKKELKDFAHWPVVLKRVQGCRGEFVERAENIDEAVKVVKSFWEKGNERMPIIAQEYINSDSYRVTTIGSEIVQSAIKRRSGWKATGCYPDRLYKFKIDDELEKIVKKMIKISGIKICGIDFAKQDGKWLVIEANAEPSLKLFDCEHEKLIEKTLELLLRLK